MVAGCRPGHTIVSGACVQCNAGTYQSTGGSTPCSLCPSGMISASAGAATCTACPSGQTPDLTRTTCIPGARCAWFAVPMHCVLTSTPLLSLCPKCIIPPLSHECRMQHSLNAHTLLVAQFRDQCHPCPLPQRRCTTPPRLPFTTTAAQSCCL